MRSTFFRRLLWILGTVVVVAALGLGLLVFLHHRHETRERERLTQVADKGPRIYVAPVRKTPVQRSVTLPGDVRAFNQASIYAKVQGYVRSMNVDKGDAVRAGQVLGVIESPETDQQVAAARSDVAIKRRIAVRSRALVQSGIVSQQDVDVANADLEQSLVNLKRIEALQDYEVLRAPFDGVVTARNVDPGALVSATNSGLSLVDVADPRRLRITVYAGQDVASFLSPGADAEIIQDEHPERVLHTQVTRLADALDPRTRTMLVEVDLDNREHVLIPGLFVHVTLHLRTQPLASVPTEALLVRGDKTVVALVQDNQVKLLPVEPGLNDGKTVQIKSPLPEGQLVALNLPIELGDGSHIQAEQRQQRDESAPAQGGSGDAGQGGDKPEQQLGLQQAKRQQEAPQKPQRGAQDNSKQDSKSTQ